MLDIRTLPIPYQTQCNWTWFPHVLSHVSVSPHVPRLHCFCRFAVNSFARKLASSSICAHTRGTFSPAMSVAKSFSRSTVRHATKKTFTGCLGNRRMINRRFGDVGWSVVEQSSTGRRNRGCMPEPPTRAEAAFWFARCAGKFAQIVQHYEATCKNCIQARANGKSI